MAHEKRRGLWLAWIPLSKDGYRVNLYRSQRVLCTVTVSRGCFNAVPVWDIMEVVLGEMWRRLDGTYSIEDRFHELWDEAIDAGALQGLSADENQAVCDRVWAQAVRGSPAGIPN